MKTKAKSPKAFKTNKNNDLTSKMYHFSFEYKEDLSKLSEFELLEVESQKEHIKNLMTIYNGSLMAGTVQATLDVLEVSILDSVDNLNIFLDNCFIDELKRA